jgi:GT2 family glycosyltransferase/glycosyltransferase involved in cell wall biosynthesis
MLNPLDHPVCLSYPVRLVSSAWAAHVPFGMFLVDLLRPRTIVELGTFSGVSYCALCQAVKELGLDSRCYAVDTWKGDPQAGFVGSDILEDLRRHHDAHYSGFSILVQSTFDEAVGRFPDVSIDLLHIDGYHTYEVAAHDFETWLPKMSRAGVVLLHDINERSGDFGVWRLWAELKTRYPHFDLPYEHGLGLVAVGETCPDALQALLGLSDRGRSLVRECFHLLGQRLRLRLDRDHDIATLRWTVDDQATVAKAAASQLEQKDEAIRWLKQRVNEQEQVVDGQLAVKDQQLAVCNERLRSLAFQLEQRTEAVQWLKQHLSEQERSFSAERAERDRIIGARDENLTTVQAALSMAHDAARRAEARIDSLSITLAEQERHARALAAELAIRQQTIDSLSTELAQQRSRFSQHEHVLLARDEGIEWLRRQLAESQERNRLLSSQLEATHLELQGSHARGERLLNLGAFAAFSRWLLSRGLGLLSPGAVPSTPLVSDSESATADPVTPGPEGPEEFISFESIPLRGDFAGDAARALVARRPPETPLRRADVICFSIIDWEFRFQRPQQLMSQFALHGHRVFYISVTRFLPADAEFRIRVRQIKDNVYDVELACTRPPDVYGDAIDGGAETALVGALARLRRTFDIDEAVGYVMIASWRRVALAARSLFGWRLVYDCMDEWENFPGIKPVLLAEERELVRECDVLVVTARHLYQKWQAHNPRIVLARNAVDVGFYARRYGPNALLLHLKHPVIGYYGAIADWFDVDLVAEAARRRPEYTFVLLGGVFAIDVSPLKDLGNVYLLGQQPYEMMPQYLYHFDAAMIPFKINPITAATDPVKVYEYLSAGKPVVSVALPELEPLGDCVYLAENADDFVRQLDRAVSEDGGEVVERRRSFAERNTWADRYRLIEAGVTDATARASVVVVTYNNLSLSMLCLESIIRSTAYPNYEVVIVDNASTDGTPTYLRYVAARYRHVRVILNSVNQGFPRATNQGIAESRGEIVVVLNNDIVVTPGWLSRLVRHLRDPAIGLVGPVTNFVGNEAKVETHYETLGEMEELARERAWMYDGEVADIHMLAMFCVALLRRTYDQLGPLDEGFGVGMFEDDDYSHRAKLAGYRVVCAADVFVHHVGQAAFKKLIEKGDYNGVFETNRRRYESKWNIHWEAHRHGKLSFGRHEVNQPV